MSITKETINPATGKAYAVNPATGNWDDSYWSEQVEPKLNQTGQQSGFSGDPVEQAKKMNEFYKTENQPAIQSYEASKTPLKQRYADLITSIKGNQVVAENRQTVTTSNELGKRGLSGSSGVSQQAMTDALNPVTQTYTGMIKDTTNQENIDMSNIENIIAKLKSGNPESAMSTSQSANQFQSSLDETAKQNAISNALAQQVADTKTTSNPYLTLGEGQTVYDPTTGKALYTAPKTYKDVQSDLGWS